MNKKGLSSLELTAIINELQFLVKGRISQIYHQEKKELLFQLHAPNEGKCLLKIVPGRYLCLTKNKETPLRPSGFCMQLRKYINNAVIKTLYQKESERIVIFELESGKGTFNLIIELFSKGNLILTDRKYMMIGVLESQIWKDREVKAKQEYIFPTPGFNWKTIDEKKLENILKQSEKKNLATSLAIEIGLGGLYAEEVCKINDINPQQSSLETKNKEIKLIVKTIKDLLKKIETPTGYLYEDQITPFPLVEGEEEKEEVKSKTKTYSEAVDTLNPFRTVSPYEKRIIALEKTIEGQNKAIGKLKDKIEINKQKGELIYGKYSGLQKLLDIVRELKKTKEWDKIEHELKKEKKIKKIDLKNKKVTIDL